MLLAAKPASLFGSRTNSQTDHTADKTNTKKRLFPLAVELKVVERMGLFDDVLSCLPGSGIGELLRPTAY